MASELVWVAYPVASVVVVRFGLFALTVALLHLRRSGKDSQEFFLTARNSASIFRVSWSFFAGVMGSWALFSAPSYAYTSCVPLRISLPPHTQNMGVIGNGTCAAPLSFGLSHLNTSVLPLASDSKRLLPLSLPFSQPRGEGPGQLLQSSELMLAVWAGCGPEVSEG